MLATDSRRIKAKWLGKPNQDGVAAVEFALIAFTFFLIVFTIMEIARLMYMYNTLPEVTRRVADAAANINFTDEGALNLARKRGIFDEANGNMPFGSPVTYQNIRIEYLYLPAGESELKLMSAKPSCPARNKLNCIINPNGNNCIRAVQVRICAEGTTGSTCTPISYQTVFPLVDLPVKLPQALTIVTAETLGYKTGEVPCP